MTYFLVGLGVFLVGVVIYDLLQEKHTILRNFPLIGHLRYLVEHVGPELRQYIVTSNNEELPFSRNQRRWVYAVSKGQNDMFGFGTDANIEAEGHPIIKPASFPIPAPEMNEVGGPPHYHVPCAKILGERHNRRKAFRPESIINISGMSYGALSAEAVSALNLGAKAAGCLQNTGEGGLSKFHKEGGNLIFQVGTAYFGCRDKNGNLDIDALIKLCQDNPQVRAVEIKLSQGAKPGLGGTLPGVKVTQAIADARGVEVGKTVKSPNHHSAFRSVQEMIDLIEKIAEKTGLPVGIKNAVGELPFWEELATCMKEQVAGPDFINIDGGEGGTGSAPLVYTDHMSLPFQIGFSRVYKIFAEAEIAKDIVWIGGGKLGLPYRATLAFALGCDMVNVGREAMFSIGCIQAQRCHTNHCPTGVATQSKWLRHGLDPTLKSERCATYIRSLRKELMSISRTCGLEHPALLHLNQLEIIRDHLTTLPAVDAFGYKEDWGLPHEQDQDTIKKLMKNSGTQLGDKTQSV